MKIKSSTVILSLVIIAFVVVFIACIPPVTEEKTTVPATVHPEVNYDMGCADCHMTETPAITKAWKSSGHGKMNFGCYICHGDGVEYFTSKPSSEGCISCHSGSMEHLEDVGETGCFDCHNGHSLIAE